MRYDIPTYIVVSVVAFVAAFFFTLYTFPWTDLHVNSTLSCSTDNLDNACPPSTLFIHFLDVLMNHIETHKLNLAIHVNLTICGALLFGQVIVKHVFSRLFPSESQQMYDRVLNFLLFKVIFIGAVMDPAWPFVLRLSMWVGMLGFLHIFALLGRDRFDQLATRPQSSSVIYYRVTALLSIISILNILWYIGSLRLFPTQMVFLTLEFLPVVLDTIQVITRYLSHLISLWQENDFENKRLVNYYTEISVDVVILFCTLLQYLQLLWMHGASIGLVDIVLVLNVKSVLKNLYNKVIIQCERWRAISCISNSYVNATADELSTYNDNCAICRDKMKAAKKLTCGHLFHLHCLYSWVQHHVSKPTCPTCRRSLTLPPSNHQDTKMQ